MKRLSEKVKAVVIRRGNEYEEDEIHTPRIEKSDTNWIRAYNVGIITSERRDYTDSELLDLALTELEEIKDALG